MKIHPQRVVVQPVVEGLCVQSLACLRYTVSVLNVQASQHRFQGVAEAQQAAHLVRAPHTSRQSQAGSYQSSIVDAAWCAATTRVRVNVDSKRRSPDENCKHAELEPTDFGVLQSMWCR